MAHPDRISAVWNFFLFPPASSGSGRYYDVFHHCCIFMETEEYLYVRPLWTGFYDYCDVKAYIQNANNSYKPSDQWQCDNVFDAKTIMDWRCMDWGVEEFLNDTDSNVHVLVLSSSLWDHYSAELTGHVILQDNGYLIMSSERY